MENGADRREVVGKSSGIRCESNPIVGRSSGSRRESDVKVIRSSGGRRESDVKVIRLASSVWIRCKTNSNGQMRSRTTDSFHTSTFSAKKTSKWYCLLNTHHILQIIELLLPMLRYKYMFYDAAIFPFYN